MKTDAPDDALGPFSRIPPDLCFGVAAARSQVAVVKGEWPAAKELESGSPLPLPGGRRSLQEWFVPTELLNGGAAATTQQCLLKVPGERLLAMVVEEEA